MSSEHGRFGRRGFCKTRFLFQLEGPEIPPNCVSDVVELRLTPAAVFTDVTVTPVPLFTYRSA